MIRFLILTFILYSCSNTSTNIETDNRNEENISDPDELTEDNDIADSTPLEEIKFFQIEPKDERELDSDLNKVVKTIELAIVKKDLDLLFTVMNEDVISSYGGGEIGVQGIMHIWGDDLGEFWKKLDWIVGLGGFFESDTVYRLPYCDEFKRFPEIPDSMNIPYGYGMCVKEETKLYPFPNLEMGQSIEMGFAFAFVNIDFGVSGKMGDVFFINPYGTKMHGYVKATDFYLSSDYCLIIEKNENKVWKITAFAPWD